jgi:hypothetical protein
MNNRKRLSFFKPYDLPVIKKKAVIADCPLLLSKYQPYCWQVALQQSLLPLGADKQN